MVTENGLGPKEVKVTENGPRLKAVKWLIGGPSLPIVHSWPLTTSHWPLYFPAVPAVLCGTLLGAMHNPSVVSEPVRGYGVALWWWGV
jgi:hypothetical protein